MKKSFCSKALTGTQMYLTRTWSMFTRFFSRSVDRFRYSHPAIHAGKTSRQMVRHSLVACIASLLFSAASLNAFALTAICAPPPCANEITLQSVRTALQTVVAQEATLRQLVTISQTQLTLLQNQLAPAGAPAVFTSAYPASTPLTVADCLPKNGNVLNIPVAAAVTSVCAQFNTAITQFSTAQQLFDTEMTQLSTQFQTLSTPAAPTIYGVLSSSLQVQVLQGKQANLIGRHMANVAMIQKRLSALESDLARARGRFVFGGN